MTSCAAFGRSGSASQCANAFSSDSVSWVGSTYAPAPSGAVASKAEDDTGAPAQGALTSTARCDPAGRHARPATTATSSGPSSPPSTAKPSSASGSAGAKRLQEPVAQDPELQGVEDLVHLVAVPLAEVQVVRADTQRHVADELGELAVALDAGDVGAQRVTGLAGDLVDPVDQGGQRPELLDPLGRGLLADAGDAGQVVAGVTAQRREVGVLRRRQAVLVLDLLRGESANVADCRGVVEHGDVVVDELERVAVAGDDEDVHAVLGGLGGEGGDHVVGFETFGRTTDGMPQRRAPRGSG